MEHEATFQEEACLRRAFEGCRTNSDPGRSTYIYAHIRVMQGFISPPCRTRSGRSVGGAKDSLGAPW